MPADIAKLTIPQTLIELDIEPDREEHGGIADRFKAKRFAVFDDLLGKLGVTAKALCAMPLAIVAKHVNEATGGAPAPASAISAAMAEYRKERT